MRIYLNNIAKIKEANIEINGITVIAGENDTGKSTIGKALFSLFHSLLFIDKKIIENKDGAIKNQVFRFLNSLENSSPSLIYCFKIVFTSSIDSNFNSSSVI